MKKGRPKLRETCLSVFQSVVISGHGYSQQFHSFEFSDTLHYIANIKIIVTKNQKLDFNGCQFTITSETCDTITIKPYNNLLIGEEVLVIIDHDGISQGRLYSIFEGEKHDVNLISNISFPFNKSELVLHPDGKIYGGIIQFSHCSHYSHFSSSPTP